MKTDKIIFSAFAALSVIAAVSCNKAYEVVDPDFDVTVPSTVKVGEKTPFQITGAADIVSFFSGEEGHVYELSKEEKIIPCDSLYFSFASTTNKSKPYDSAPNPEIVPISYSTDFAGDCTKSAMDLATWTDISDRFAYPQARDVKAYPSGLVNVDDLFKNNEKVYFRLFYRVEADIPKGSNQRSQWTLANMNFTTKINGNSYTVWDIYEMNWGLVKGLNYDKITSGNEPQYPASNGRDYILFKSQASPEFPIEMWLISGPISKVDFNLGKDYPIAIKATADPKLTKYEYVYSTPGTYTATFVAKNANFRGSKEVVKSVTFEVVKDEGSISGFDNEEWK